MTAAEMNRRLLQMSENIQVPHFIRFVKTDLKMQKITLGQKQIIIEEIMTKTIKIE